MTETTALSSRIRESDKFYWHRYTEIYEPIFSRMSDIRLVVEIGVLRGDSIAWLAERFPLATIVGVDILPVQPAWPVSSRIQYVQADQADRAAILRVFGDLAGQPDLVIEDGSHIPQHQATCLAEGFARLKAGGLYILEDICTSHPLTEAFAQHARRAGKQLPTALHVLMALQHLRDSDAELDTHTLERLAHPDFLSVADIALLWLEAERIDIHRRTKLPLRCHACGESNFNYVDWTCACGAPLFHPTNSMTALLWKAQPPAAPRVSAADPMQTAASSPSIWGAPRALLSACVISYNRSEIIETTLSALAFADEIILVDKSSTDGTAALAARHVDRLISVPWSPTVEETRAYAISECQHDWILYLDDDECLSPEAVLFIDAELRNPRADVYRFPLRHYILGRHDERAYYWPEAHVRMFRRGTVGFHARVHDGLSLHSDSVFDIPVDSGVCIHHLSHADAAQWIDKTNRYTSRPNRSRVDPQNSGLFAFAHEAIEHWALRTHNVDAEGYPEVVALLRALYDIVDRVKIWEEAQPTSGQSLFASKCAELRAAYQSQLAHLQTARAIPTGAELTTSREDMDIHSEALSESDPRHEKFRDAIHRKTRRVQVLEQALLEAHMSLGHVRRHDAHLQQSLAEAHESLAELRLQAGTLEQSLRQANTSLQHLQLRQSALEQSTADARAALEQANAQLALVFSSRSWTMTRPYRELGASLRSAVPRLRDVARRGVALTARAVFRTLPLPAGLRQRCQELAFTHAGHLFKGFWSYEVWAMQRARRQELETKASAAQLAAAEARAAAVAAIETLRFPECASPRVTVIIPTYGNLSYTAACLGSIARHWPSTPTEVLVVEDASGDPDIQRLAGIPGLRFMNNPSNLGFLRSCNRAARLSQASHLFFLNNDTEVTEGWLDSLVSLMDREPDCGLAGSKLVYPDGRLQEAGGILWRDASAWNFGRFDDPARSVYNYVKDADYISGAAILVPRALFESLGGFDDAYAPAYYEDTDLAFRIRASGRRVRYQPNSVVIHHEGISHGNDLSSGGKAAQARNAITFESRWRSVLERAHLANGEKVFLAKDRTVLKKTVLVIDHYVPQPDRDAGSRSITQFIDVFLEHGFSVSFWPHNLWFDPDYTNALQQKGVEVFYGAEYAGKFEHFIATTGDCLDYVLLSRPAVASEYLAAIRKHSTASLLFYGHDIHYQRMAAQCKIEGRQGMEDEADNMHRIEESVWRQVHSIYYPSNLETEVVVTWLRSTGHAARVATIPVYSYGDFPDHPWSNLDQRANLLFVAGFAHPPNVGAAIWFVDQVMPLLRRELPDIVLYVVGSNPDAQVKALSGKDIVVTGYVSDAALAAHYHQARVAVAPLLFGGGMKGKVVESMRYGLPCVTSTAGAQGLQAAKEFLAVADEPESFAAHILALYRDDLAWSRVSQAAQSFARENFSRAALWRAIAPDLDPAPYEDFRRKTKGAATERAAD